MNDAQDVQVQYRDDQNLNARIALHARFSTNPYGWQRWVFDILERAGLPCSSAGPGAGLWPRRSVGRQPGAHSQGGH